jgi:ribonuclease M5
MAYCHGCMTKCGRMSVSLTTFSSSVRISSSWIRYLEYEAFEKSFFRPNTLRNAKICAGDDGSPDNKNKHTVRSLPGVLLVVEGVNDMRRIQEYLDVDVYVLGSATKSSGYDTIETLKVLSKKYARVVILLDPDVAGRQARNEIDRNIDGCWHAFIPTILARLSFKKKYKDVGDIGVEHASHKAIMTAIARSRKSNHSMKRFSRDWLVSLGLIAPMHERGNNVTRRRNLVCEFLGIGQCDGKQMLKQLNAYGFVEKDLIEALEYAQACIDSDSQ